jgi:hypothetical protein
VPLRPEVDLAAEGAAYKYYGPSLDVVQA